ncbi:MAG: glycosyltransferase family A protein [Candidatus Gastranaerophilaceae bacterium]
MKIAAGEYISFVDSDDWIDLDFLENCTMLLKSMMQI